MPVEITEDASRDFVGYAAVPIVFEADARFDVRPPDRASGIQLVERRLDTPFRKDYDDHAGNHPTEWPSRFEVRNWGVLVAREDGRRVGGAVVAMRTPGLDLLEARQDLAMLWDIRVIPDARGRGIGSALLAAAEAWAAARGVAWLKIETQNVNPEACRFYASRGYALREANRLAYPGLPDEVQLLWFKELE